ncbi:unnamed protein product [Parnassius apollo]|uniref:(apollo) hypothetical protein n=1 Tax=Parnassius apollo TaxID=110799 RepID=A0A8S3XNF5_PARAO|nr:unnamed protein product [Parnassius apollo]
MDLHLHLTVASRALDRKWGKPIDLDTPEEITTCIPAVVDNPTTTFSSEEYLKSIKRNRPKPYSRIDVRRRSKANVKLCDSFSNISVARVPSTSDFRSLDNTLDSGFVRSSFDISEITVTNDLAFDIERTENETFEEVISDTNSSTKMLQYIKRKVFKTFKVSSSLTVNNKLVRI